MGLKAAVLTTAALDHKSASEGRAGAPLGDFGEYLGLPWGNGWPKRAFPVPKSNEKV